MLPLMPEDGSYNTNCPLKGHICRSAHKGPMDSHVLRKWLFALKTGFSINQSRVTDLSGASEFMVLETAIGITFFPQQQLQLKSLLGKKG
jgi:hypothetical protein